MLQIREIATQLYLLDVLDTQETENCTECGEAFEIYEHNPYTLCRDCVDTLQALADIRNDFLEKRDGLTAQEKAQEVQDLRDRVRNLSFTPQFRD